QKNQSQQENSFHLFYLPFTWTRQGTVPCPGSVLGDRGRFPVPVTCGKKPVHQSGQGRSTKVNPSAGVSREQPATRSRKGTGKSQTPKEPGAKGRKRSKAYQNSLWPNSPGSRGRGRHRQTLPHPPR